MGERAERTIIGFARNRRILRESTTRGHRVAIPLLLVVVISLGLSRDFMAYYAYNRDWTVFSAHSFGGLQTQVCPDARTSIYELKPGSHYTVSRRENEKIRIDSILYRYLCVRYYWYILFCYLRNSFAIHERPDA